MTRARPMHLKHDELISFPKNINLKIKFRKLTIAGFKVYVIHQDFSRDSFKCINLPNSEIVLRHIVSITYFINSNLHFNRILSSIFKEI